MQKKRGRRRDAYPLPRKGDVSALFPFLMKRRSDSCVYFTVRIDVEPLMAFLDKRKAAGDEIGFFPFFVAAVVRLLHERPGMNRYVIGRTLYQREDAFVSFIAKRDMTEAADEITIKNRFAKDATFRMVVDKLKKRVHSIKKDGEKEDSFLLMLMRMPRFVLMAVVKIFEWLDFFGKLPADIEAIDPLRASAFIANLGSIGVDAPYHHLYEWSTCSLFVAIGRIQKYPVVEGDALALKQMVEVKVTLDERIADGFYFARSLDLLKTYFEDPEQFIREMDAGAIERSTP